MDDRRFGAQVVSIPDDVRLRMRGDLDSQADETLTSAYGDVERLGAHHLTLDFTDVGYINSWSITF